MRLCERRAGDCAGRGRWRRGLRSERAATTVHRLGRVSRATPRHDGAGRAAGRTRWAAQGGLRVGCAARPTNTLTELIFASSLSPHPLLSPETPTGFRVSSGCPPAAPLYRALEAPLKDGVDRSRQKRDLIPEIPSLCPELPSSNSFRPWRRRRPPRCPGAAPRPGVEG